MHNFLTVVLAIPPLLVAFGGPLVLVAQALQWLKSGIWPPMPFSSGLDYLGWPTQQTDMKGLQMIYDFVPLSLTMLVLGMWVFIMLGFSLTRPTTGVVAPTSTTKTTRKGHGPGSEQMPTLTEHQTIRRGYKMVLIDGKQLTALMLRHNVGVRVAPCTSKNWMGISLAKSEQPSSAPLR